MFTHTGEVYVSYLRLSRKVKLRETAKFWIDETGVKYKKDTGKVTKNYVPYLRLETIKGIEEE